MFIRATSKLLALLGTLVMFPACSMGDMSDSEGLTTVGGTAVGGEDGGEAGDAGDPDGLDDEVPPTELPDDPDAEDESAPPELLIACDLPVPCEFPVELVRESKTQSYADSDLCALEALANEDAGLIQTVAAFASAESYLDHVFVGPGEVLRQAHGRSNGLGMWQKPVERCKLKAPAYFAACAASYDPACLDPEQWVRSCEVLDGLTCPQP